MDRLGYLGLFVALVGGVALIWAWRGNASSKALSQAAQRWPTAQGVINDATVVLQGYGRSAYWLPAISYAYSVTGREFVGGRIRFGYIGTRGRGAAERMIAPYPVGSVVAVRYDPQDPQSSVLEADRVTSNYLIGAICGAVVLALGLAIVVLNLQGTTSRAGRPYAGVSPTAAPTAGPLGGAPTTNANGGGGLGSAANEEPQRIGDTDASWLVGSWGNDGDCRRPMVLTANNDYVGADGATGSWYLGLPGSSTLNFRTGAGTVVTAARKLGADGLRIEILDTHRVVTMRRCSASR